MDRGRYIRAPPFFCIKRKEPKMKIPEFEIRALKFIKNDFMPVLPSSLYRFLGWVGVAAFSGRVEQAIVEHQGLLRIAGVINGDEIDIDRLEAIGNAAFEHEPAVEVWKLKLTKPDFEKFIKTLRDQQ